jgi:hypothetical protein
LDFLHRKAGRARSVSVGGTMRSDMNGTTP